MIYAKETEKIRAQVSGREKAGENERRQVELADIAQSRCGVSEMPKCCLLSLLAFMLSLCVNKKERLALTSVLSLRATKQASHSLADTDTKLGGCGSGATTRAVERCGGRWVHC